MIRFVGLGVAALLLSTSASYAQSATAMAVMRACKPDIAQYCSAVAPGGGRIKECMKAHQAELSPSCKEAVFQAWLTK